MGKWRTWRPSEVERLRVLVGQMPMPLVLQHYNRWAERQGIPVRSEASLRRKALELGLSVVPRGSWVTLNEVRRLLKRSPGCIHGWAAAGWVRHCHGALHRGSLQRLARQRPHLFAGCPVDGLLELLRDEGLVAQLVAAHPQGRAIPRRPQAVECLETGQRFASFRAAGRALFLDGSGVGRAITEDREACGFRFRLVA